MSIFAISDLHLSLSSDKPMDIFKGWENYQDRIAANWKRLIKPSDTVVLPGDFSWGLKLEDTIKDFEFLESLPGKKILLKGNHDLWWQTMKKMEKFLKENNFNSISLIFNNCIEAEGYAIAGTRGWFFDEGTSKKVLLREAGRLDASLKAAEETGLPILTFLHYPPAYNGQKCDEILDVLKAHNIDMVYYGHIHGQGFHNADKECDGIKLKLISCDCIDFVPYFIV